MTCLGFADIAECMKSNDKSARVQRSVVLAHQLQIGGLGARWIEDDRVAATGPEMTEANKNVLRIDRNCNSQVHSDAVGILVDGEDYFAAARNAMKKARNRIVLVAWEFHSQTELNNSEPDDGLPTEIGPFLNALLDRNETLEVYILVWDYSLIYLQEREWKVFSQWLRDPHPRLQFVTDDTAPTGASHHQKLLCIDDSLVFCGGMDISISRWDSHEHLVEDARRVNPDGKSYDPYHDVHTVLSGKAAEALCELAYGRWENATGEALSTIEGRCYEELWPTGVSKVFQDIEIALSIIYASPTEDPSQMDQLHLDLFEAAEDFIFIENQYFSSSVLAEVLEKQLRKKNGPEVIMLLPKTTSGWLVESTVGLLRDRLLERLEEADSYDRLRILTPMTREDDGTDTSVYIHAKVLVIDDKILKIGSSNLSNRSMKVDSECDLTFEFSEMDTRVRDFRRSLLAMHQDRTISDWGDEEENSKGLVEALDGRSKEGSRWLEDYVYGCDSDIKRRLADTQLLDPDDPIYPQYWLDKSFKKEERPFVWKRIVSVSASLAVALALVFGLIWGWGELLGKEQTVAWLDQIKQYSWAPLLIFFGVAIGGSLGVPLNILLVAIVVVMGTWAALIFGVGGALVSAILGFFVGRLLGQPLMKRLKSDLVQRVSSKLGERSYKSVALIRLVPVAPFFLINLLAGASKLKFKDYLAGSALGMIPGMVVVIFLVDRAGAVVRRPDWDTVILFAVALSILVGGLFYIKKGLKPENSG